MSSFFLKPRVLFYLLPFLGGLLYSMGFPMKGMPHFMGFSFLGYALLFMSLSLPYPESKKTLEGLYQRKLSAKLLTGLLFCAGHCLSGYYWIPYTLNEFGQIPFPLNILLGQLFSLIIMPQLLIFILIFHFWTNFNIKNTVFAGGIHTRNIFFAIILSALDNLIAQQFPAHLGHTWLQLAPYLGAIQTLGVPSYSFMSYWFILSLVCLWRVGKIDFLGIGAFSLFIIFNFFNPLQWNPEIDSQPTQLRLVQANIGNFSKLQSEAGDKKSIHEIYDLYYKLSTAPSKDSIDLILWPETAYPQLLNSALLRMNPDYMPSVIRKTAMHSKAQLFFGGYDKSKEEDGNFYETEYNAAFFVDDDGQFNDVYHKQKLIPFGEALPFGPLNFYLAKIIQNISFFARGERFTQFTLNNDKTFVTAICYEILFSPYIRNFLNQVQEKPDFLVNLTNDSWYGDTSEPYQHQFLSHWRALEFNIPIVRMTNTGISSILYPDGSESKRLEIFKEGYLDVELHTPQSPATLWQRFGIVNYIIYSIFCFMLGVLFESFLYPKKKKTSNNKL